MSPLLRELISALPANCCSLVSSAVADLRDRFVQTSTSTVLRCLVNAANRTTQVGKTRVGANLGPKLGPTGPIFRFLAVEGQLNQRDFWSGRWESNPRPKLGKLLYCHCTTPALAMKVAKPGKPGKIDIEIVLKRPHEKRDIGFRPPRSQEAK